jgi:hypothetical protein
MINLQLPQDNPFERLKSRTGYAEFIQNFANRLLAEPAAISEAVLQMEKSMDHPARERAIEWARVHDAVANAVGLELSAEAVKTKDEMDSYRSAQTQYVEPTTTMQPYQPVTEATQIVPGTSDADMIRAKIDGMHATTIEEARSAFIPDTRAA